MNMMTNVRPAPFTPANCDLRDFPAMLLDCTRLRRSKAWLIAKRQPELGFYMVNLWTAMWHEVPAASIEADDDALADAAMCSPRKWARIRHLVMHGLVECSDGRLYHPVIAEKANEAWGRKNAWRARSRKGNEARWGANARKSGDFPNSLPGSGHSGDDSLDRPFEELDDHPFENARVPDPSRIPEGVPDGSLLGSQGKGEVSKKENHPSGGRALVPAAPAPRARKPAAARATRLPAEWTASATDLDYARSQGLNPRPVEEDFRDYWLAKSGQDATKTDWPATWRRWCRNCVAKGQHLAAPTNGLFTPNPRSAPPVRRGGKDLSYGLAPASRVFDADPGDETIFPPGAYPR